MKISFARKQVEDRATQAKQLPLCPSVAKKMETLFASQVPLHPSVAKTMDNLILQKEPPEILNKKPDVLALCPSVAKSMGIRFVSQCPLCPSVAKSMGIQCESDSDMNGMAFKKQQELPLCPWVAEKMSILFPSSPPPKTVDPCQMDDQSKERPLHQWVAQTMKIQFGEDKSMTPSMPKIMSVKIKPVESALSPSVANAMKIKFVSQHPVCP
jgi:hypothetical protein